MKSEKQRLHLEKLREVNRKRKTGKFIKCKSCGKKFYVYSSRYKRAKKKGHKTKYCSHKCYSRKGENNYFWRKNKRYKRDDEGYIRIFIKGKLKRKHRILAEIILQRKLKNNEIIHHINGIRDDNRLKNLRLMTKVEHCKYHSLKNPPKLNSNICLN